jgi:hypothetical protein
VGTSPEEVGQFSIFRTANDLSLDSWSWDIFVLPTNGLPLHYFTKHDMLAIEMASGCDSYEKL